MLKRDDQEHILGMCVVGDYILSFKSRWIELLYVPPFPGADRRLTSRHGPDHHCLRLNYPEVAFAGASLSEPQPNPESPDDSRIVYVLARQLAGGLFYFRVTIHNPDYAPSGPKAGMDLDLLGVYKLNKNRVGIRGKTDPRLVLGAWLGSEGKRGIWTERSSHELNRSVVAASFNQSPSAGVPVESGDDLQELCELAPRIESTGSVFIVDSWNPDGE